MQGRTHRTQASQGEEGDKVGLWFLYCAARLIFWEVWLTHCVVDQCRRTRVGYGGITERKPEMTRDTSIAKMTALIHPQGRRSIK
jgi:hypothetical protein